MIPFIVKFLFISILFTYNEIFKASIGHYFFLLNSSINCSLETFYKNGAWFPPLSSGKK